MPLNLSSSGFTATFNNWKMFRSLRKPPGVSHLCEGGSSPVQLLLVQEWGFLRVLNQDTRILWDPENPLGPYICGYCSHYKTHNGRLPMLEHITKMETFVRRWEAAVPDAECYSCKSLE